MANLASPELYINMKDKPEWNDLLEYEDQPESVKQFWVEELKKLKYGININGVFIHPWLYWHINFWNIVQDIWDEKLGKEDRKPRVCKLRDNEWYFAECLKRAEEEKKGVIMFGTRRGGKTAMISSYLGCRATMTVNNTHLVTGFSDSDLSEIGNYTEYGLDHVPPYLFINRTKNDWAKGVILGTKNVSNLRDIHARIVISNVDMGKKKSTQKSAGATPTTYIFDEIGKGPVLGPLKPALAGLRSSLGFRDVPILAGTSNAEGLSRDAEELLSDPGVYGFLDNCWDFLNFICPPEHKTWKERKWSMFVPSQMSLSHIGVKEEKKFGDFLGRPNDLDLNKIKIQATNFELSNKAKEKYMAEIKAKNKSFYDSERIFYPGDPEECFLNASVNTFPVDVAQYKHSQLLQHGQPGRLVEPYRDANGKVHFKNSEKKLAPFPFNGGIWDAPILMFEEPPENPSYEDFIYVAGLDNYKQSVSSTNSLGSFYIYKRYVDMNDPFAERIVACLTTRPPSISMFCEWMEMMQDAYGAVCLMEGADLIYHKHLEDKGKDLLLLANGLSVAKTNINSGAKQNVEVGLAPTLKNIAYIEGLYNQYTWENITVDGKTTIGVTRIDDPALLLETMDYKEGGNYDRIRAFGHALALAKYYHKLGLMPPSKTNQLEKDRREEKRKQQMKVHSAFSKVRIHNTFGKVR